MARVKKPKTTEKVETKEVKKEKPVVTEARAISRSVGVTPRKMRLVADLVRGKKVSDAIALLHNINKAASVPLRKTIESAAANAINNHGFKEEGLYISELQINDSIKLKRYRPRAKGGAAGVTKRTSTIIVKVKESV
ncbi:MAG: 50S ribosomal protein L22 [Tenericutes bacterium ADurb.Bin239]|nr:MAG: 50S ribosomal protein L22 [Tenericutes bacterium ADurb.Bin239]